MTVTSVQSIVGEVNVVCDTNQTSTFADRKEIEFFEVNLFLSHLNVLCNSIISLIERFCACMSVRHLN